MYNVQYAIFVAHTPTACNEVLWGDQLCEDTTASVSGAVYVGTMKVSM